MNDSNLLEVENLSAGYSGKRGRLTPVLHDVSLSVRPAETLGLVGESGSGKSTLGRVVLGLLRPTSGRVRFDGIEITELPATPRRRLATDLQVVFQDPYSSLNPMKRVGETLAEPLRAHGASRAEARTRVRETLEAVGLPADAATRTPSRFSGGQRQRIAIARAIVLRPKLVVCDEPVSALDLTTQKRVLDLFVDLQDKLGLSYLFITHDLAVVRYVSHRVCVLQHGRVVEEGHAEQVTEQPRQSYTRRLMLSSPIADPSRQRERREQLDTFLAGHRPVTSAGPGRPASEEVSA